MLFSLIRYLFYLIVMTVVLLWGLSYYVDYQLSHKDFPDSFDDCHKIWSARGIYGDGIEQNSIQSMQAAAEEGAVGAEVDIFYDTQMKDFIVSHSRPYSKKQGRILRLSELFDATEDGFYYWLDFKRIRHLSDEQTQDAIQRLHAISEKSDRYKRLYVEGEAPFTILQYRKAGFHTIYDTHPEPESNAIISAIMINLYKIIFYYGGHSVMGMEYGELDDPVFGPENRKRLKDVPLFLYHVPVDESLVNDLLATENIRAFIVGNNVSVNLHDMNSCNQ